MTVKFQTSNRVTKQVKVEVVVKLARRISCMESIALALHCPSVDDLIDSLYF